VCAVMVPASEAEALGMLESAVGFLADADWAQVPAGAVAECLRGREEADAVGAAARGRMLRAFDAAGRHLAAGQRSTRTWRVHCLRVTRGQAGEYGAVQALVKPGDLVLDIGAGTGALTVYLVRAGARVIAVELHPGWAVATTTQQGRAVVSSAVVADPAAWLPV
jgi:SAM-dependent methyltransferase